MSPEPSPARAEAAPAPPGPAGRGVPASSAAGRRVRAPFPRRPGDGLRTWAARRGGGAAPRAGGRDPLAWLIAAAVFAAYTVISVSRYVRLDPGSWDLGIYTEYVKQLAWLRPPIVDIRGAGFNLLGDHFQPIVALLAPFFRLFPSPVTLLVAQALLTAVSVLPVCRAAGELLGPRPARAIGLAYGFSWGLQQMIDFDFHEIAFAVPLLAFAGSAALRGRPWAAAAWALPLVFVKEDQGFTVAGLGLVMAGAAIHARLSGDPPSPAARWVRRGAAAGGTAGPRAAAAADGRGHGAAAWAGAGALLVVWGLAWSAAAIMVIIPHFNPLHHYEYWDKGGVLAPGGHLTIGALLSQASVSATAKLRTLALVLAPTAFLALGSRFALVALPSLALRFLSTNVLFWGDGYHYSATVMPILFLAAIDTLAGWQARPARGAAPRAAAASPVLGVAAGAMLAVAAMLAVWFPLAQLWNPQTYVVSSHVKAEYAAMARVPPGTTVEATLSMLATLATRDTAFWVGSSGDPAPRYIVFDAANSGYTPAPTDIGAFVAQQHPGALYRRIFEASDVYVYRLVRRTSR